MLTHALSSRPIQVILAALFAVLFVMPSSASAAINQQINFQGKLANPDGTNVTDGNYSIVFSLYAASSGGSAIWAETQPSVAVAAGNFQVDLGSITALPGSVDFNSASIYLGVKVGADAEMTPRIRFTATPYAFNADRLGGLQAGSFVQLSPGAQQIGNINISGTVNGNTLTGSSLQFGTADAATLLSASGQGIRLDTGTTGNVGVGTTNATSVTIGKVGAAVSAPGGLTIDSGANVPTADQLIIDNSASTGVATAGVNGASIRFKGGAAAVESSGLRVDFTPGGTTGGMWNGVRIVETAAATSGVATNGIKLESAGAGAGTSTAVSIATGWDIGVDIQSGGIRLAAQADPAAPATGNLLFYAKDIAGRVLPKWIGPAGVDTPVQASFGFNRIAMMAPVGAGTNCGTSLTLFATTVTAAGTCSYPAITSTNLKTSVRRMAYSSGTTAGTVAYQRQGALMVWRGNAADRGGFFYTVRFSLNTMQTGNRAFVGLSDSIANPTNTDPTTNTTPGKIGVAINSNTGNWNFVHNVTGTAPTVVALGATMPLNTTDMIELILFSAPDGSSIGYRVQNLATAATVSGSISTNLPASTTFLAPVMSITNNATAAAAIIETAGWYLESDN